MTRILLLFSGKRKSGKDYISGKLNQRLGDKSQIIRISEPIKSAWAKKFNLDLKELLSDGPYKEKYRKDMIVWSDEVRAKDYGSFCREALKEANKPVVIISDIRRKTDIRYFKEDAKEHIFSIRISCLDEIRRHQGWVFQSGVDDVQSECDLDDYSEWDIVISNNGKDVDHLLDQIIAAAKI